MADPGFPVASHSSSPFRGELLTTDRLAQSGRDTGAQQRWTSELAPRDTPLLSLVDAASAALARHNSTLAEAVRKQHPISPAAEWLLDNYYLIEEQIRLVRDDLPSHYGRELPRLIEGDFTGYPRVFAAVVEMLSHTDARIDEDYLLAYTNGYQDSAPLSIGEVWAIPIMLRVALVENLRRLADSVVAAHGASRSADEWADRLLLAAPEEPAALRSLVRDLESQVTQADPVFLMRLSQRLSGQETESEALGAWLERHVRDLGIALDDLAHSLQQQQASDQVSIANTITSVRFLDAFEWRNFFETVSIVEQILREDPVGVYPRMDFKSRDRQRHALEQIARRSKLDEIEVAEAVVSTALAALNHDPTDEIAGHVGFHLIAGGRYAFEQAVGYRSKLRERLYRGPLANKGLFYWGLLAIATAVLVGTLGAYIVFVGAGPWPTLIVLLLSLIPLSDLALSITNRVSAWVFPPRVMCKYDYLEPVSEAHRTLVVVPALMTSVKSVCHVLDNLEIAYLANRDEQIAYGLLGDLRGGDNQDAEGDAEIIEAAYAGVNQLNRRYLVEHGREPFCLFIRGRSYNDVDDVWMGWERKRGSLDELSRSLRGSTDTSFTHRLGDEAFLSSVTFVLTLDADTILPRDAARKLISTIAHPLNRAQLNPTDVRVRRGYGLIQPRVSMTLPGSTRSVFASLYSGVTGIDPYTGAISDTYQDVFGEGSYTGKGIFEVNVYNAMLEGRFPENTLLSHDLIEGCLIRVGLASSIEVLDDYPASYLSHAARLHRWVRGDWQIARWLLPFVPGPDGRATLNPLSLLHRWKIFDNLRRSLVPPMLLLLITVGWLLLPGPSWAWPLAMLLVILFPAYFGVADSLTFRTHDISLAQALPSIWREFGADSARALLSLVLLPHQAYLMVDAMARALWRTHISHVKMLEWETAADVERRLGSTVAGFTAKLAPSSVVATALLIPVVAAQPTRVLPALALAALWLGSPLIAWRISIAKVPEEQVLDAPGIQEVRRLARRTWRFFETFVVPEGHNLAPDNFQEFPNGEVAWRTSPTNIGLQLLSTLGAHDLGYVTLPELIQRTSDTLTAMAGLERFRGHFYNWYDIRTLSPLPPNYISTVDSGNLAGHLLVLRVGLLEISEGPLIGPQLLSGVIDTASLAVEDLYAEADHLSPSSAVRACRELLDEIGRDVLLEERPNDLGQWHSLLVRLETLVAPVLQEVAHLRDGEPDALSTSPHPSSSLDRVRESVSALGEMVTEARTMLDTLTPWAALLSDVPAALVHDPSLNPLLRYVPSLVGLSEGLDGAKASLRATIAGPPEHDSEECVHWATAVLESLEASRPLCNEMLGRLRLNADIAREMWEHTDFKMLFDEHRLLFSIGYNTAEGRLDRSYYDMLASECRLASFLAIAKGDVPQEHWFRLGRSLTATPGGRALLSWSASMFEYLMPLLVMRSWPTTILDQTYSAVVSRQVQYGRERDVPWGVSESAFNAKDAGLVYQYQAFGVPGLGLKRGLSDDIVIAPYATVLALPVAPCDAVANLRALTDQGARGRYGYYEAIDYTPGRVAAGESRAVVKAYFAHHQGMSLIAMVNALSSACMVDRFHRDPMVQSAELLLQERVPRRVQLVQPHVSEVEHVRSLRELPPPVQRSYPLGDTPSPATHFLSNGRYSVMVTNSGGGYSRCNDMAVTRYREDITRDCWGQFVYVRDVGTGRTWPATYNPYPNRPDDYHVTFSADKAEYRRTDGELETHTEISVSPEDDAEIRRVTITNRGLSECHIQVTSYFEIALADQADDQAHKTFSNLFVETEAIADTQTLLFSRRPRASGAPRPYGIHTVACETAADCEWSYETDRARFLGRLNGSDRPLALETSGPLSNTAGAVLDPCCAIRQTVSIEPGASARFVFVTGVAETRDEAVRLSEKYHDVRSAQRAIDLAWTAAQIEMRDLGITPHESVVLQRLASRLLLTDYCSALKVKTPVENGLPMSGLWSIGISGDLPILLVRVEELEHAPLVRQALLAHQYWRHKGLIADLVILNTRPTSYADELDDRLRLLVRTGHALQLVDKPGGVFLRRADHMHPDVANLLLSVARATLEGDAGSIEVQLNRRIPRAANPDPFVAAAPPQAYPAPALQRPELLYDNGLGGFDVTNDEYVIVLDRDDVTPAPWINVMASPTFGCTVSEAGMGCTWAENSHENRITTWNNDPVTDGTGEMLYLRDEETGEFWSPTPLPVRAEEPYVVRHGKGYSRFDHTSHGLEQRVLWFVPTEDPVRIVRLSVRNLGERTRRISATQFVEWVLGSSRSKAQHQVVTWFDAEAGFLTAHNHFNPDFPGRAAFLACDCPLDSYTGSRTEFVGRNRRPANPAAMHRKNLGGLTGRFHDNCGALMTVLELEPGQEKSVTFLLGQTPTLEQARTLVATYRDTAVVDAALLAVRAQWDSILGTVKVRTPDPALDLLVNGQLLYQALACRLWGRTATYQSSGAYGFRDQLQDVIALMLARPDLVREQIVEASRHQFERGDVLHWWQPVSGRGVRTRITDDRHWLPLVASIYIEATGDDSVLDEITAFIEGPEIDPEREDAYLQPAVSERAATVYEHCVAALQSGSDVGAHGLPLMGGGDWNDGMNRVGIEGKGESVWLGWFLNVALTSFADICEARGDLAHAEEFRARAQAFVEAVEAQGWDGSWYRRAYFDDGTPLGSRSSVECRIDAIAQAWATISGAGDPERARRALDAVEDQLIDHEIGIVSLLTPPFDTMPHDPGYIKGYVPGVRENGGQYTHAAIWVAMAHLLRGNGDEGHDLISLINPINHARDRDDAERYKVEPYVVAADVYSATHHAGRGGWTWYTGSASWFYRVAIRELLGLWTVTENGQRYLVVNPCIPKSWKGYRLYFRDGETTYDIDVENPRGINRGVDRVELDGVRLDELRVPLTGDGGAHDVRVTLLGG